MAVQQLMEQLEVGFEDSFLTLVERVKLWQRLWQREALRWDRLRVFKADTWARWARRRR